MTAEATAAVTRANNHLAAGQANWCPVFADVLSAGVKVGHVVSDGYSNTHWSFYPSEDSHRAIHSRDLAVIVPKWVKKQTFGEFRTWNEMHPIVKAA